MKILNTIVAATAAFAICLGSTSCGVSDKHDEVKKLMEDDDKWSADQTDDAIDIYIKGLKEYKDNVKDIYLIMNKQHVASIVAAGVKKNGSKYFPGKKSVLDDRRDEIKDAIKANKEKQKELNKKYSDDDDNDDDNYDNDDEDFD